MNNNPKNISRINGVAILTVMISIVLMMAVITDLSSKEMVKYKIAMNERDALEAEALAYSAVNFSQIILMLQEPLQDMLAKAAEYGIPLPHYTVWKILPITSDLLATFLSEGSIFDFDNKKEEKKSENQRITGVYTPPKDGYGGFRGTFKSEITDEESKISIRKWSRLNSFPKRKLVFDQLLSILQKPENQFLFDGSLKDNNPYSAKNILGNIYDYTSEQDFAINVDALADNFGREKASDKMINYALTPNIRPKNAPFDSLAELRLVPGVSDAIYSVLAKHVSIYSESEKINLLSANDDMLSNIFYLCAKDRDGLSFQKSNLQKDLVGKWNQKKSEGGLAISVEGVQKFLQENNIVPDKENCTQSVDVKSKVFNIKASATVGNVTKYLSVVLRSSGGLSTVYKFQGL